MVLLLLAAVLGVFGCSGEKTALPAAAAAGAPAAAAGAGAGAAEAPAAVEAAGGAVIGLEEIAEIERAGGYYPGLGLAESALRERAGDYVGAVAAAYKDLSWAYGYGGLAGGLAGGGFDGEGLRRLEAFFNGDGGREKQAAAAVRGVLAFSKEQWGEAEELLTSVLSEDEDPDSFLRWMLLVCSLEKNGGAAVRSAYSSIRARYMLFPEYWYRGARAFAVSGRTGAGGIAAEYAEQCVNLSPQGPFALDCRKIIAAHIGLDSGSEAIRSKAEIEDLIERSVSSGKPELLEDLFPLISLPDNAYTLYVLGAFRAVCAASGFRDFFAAHAAKASGRLAERFNFILRG
jgi:hypothetical protein